MYITEKKITIINKLFEMENYKINHELNQYDYSEGIEFKGLMPELMNVEGIETIGRSDDSVKLFGFDAKGSDALEVVDIDAIMKDSETESDNDEPTPEPEPEPLPEPEPEPEP